MVSSPPGPEFGLWAPRQGFSGLASPWMAGVEMFSPRTQVGEVGEWDWGFLGGGPGSGPSLGPSFHHGCIPSEINKGSVGAK